MALDITPPSEKAQDAKEIVGPLFVDLVGLVDTRHTGERVTKFPSLAELHDFTISTRRYFPKQSAYAGGVLKFLLIVILG